MVVRPLGVGLNTRKRKPKRRARKSPEHVLGWREWVQLPDLGVPAIKAKLDTGARTSALHAFDLELYVQDGVDMVRFAVHPVQRSSTHIIQVESELHEERLVRNSGGEQELRPVIMTVIQVGEDRWPIELTLTRRDHMGFRMLLGRQAIRGRAVVDPGSSFRAGRRPTGSDSPPAARGLPTEPEEK